MTDIAEPTLRLTPQPAGLKHRFHAMVKPVGSLCNLNCTLDFWYSRDFGKVHVDLFETAVAQSLGLPSQRCITSEFCDKNLAVTCPRFCGALKPTTATSHPPLATDHSITEP